ncbi:MAG TPA: hypothetical protein VGK00_14465 [Anaerolineales bacterium]|jgi:hypothetical protein
MLEGVFGLLVFLISILGLSTALVLAIIALFTHRPGRAMKVMALAVGWIVLYALALLAFSFTSRPRYLAPGQERCFDEMCYSITALRVSPSLGTTSQQINARGIYYIVTIQLRSAARRTAQKPSEPDVFIIDAQGKRYPGFINAGTELDAPLGQPLTAAQLWDRKIQPGESVRRSLAFDLPVDVRSPGLVVTEGIGPLSAVLIGAETSFFHAPVEFPLNP